MKSIKTTIAAIATLASTIAFGGLYIVSGGDFRIPALEYTVETTQNNQTTNISPAKASPASAQWSVKVDGVEYDGVNSSDSYMTHTFAAAGVHKVKVYNKSGVDMSFNFGINGASATDNKNIQHIRNVTVRNNTTILMTGNKSLTNLVFKNVKTITASANFAGIASVKSTLTIQGTKPMTIGETAFGFFYGLREVVLPECVTYLNFKAFVGCDKLSSITILNKDMTINTNLVTTATNLGGTFRGCPIEKVYFPGTIAEWNGNSNFTYVFGTVAEDATPDGDGGYTLSLSQYAQTIRDILDASSFSGGTRNDAFYNKSSEGLMKLYLIQQ